MLLTGKEIHRQRIVTNITDIKCVQQIGIDLQILSIDEIVGVGMILKDKTVLPGYQEVSSIKYTDGIIKEVAESAVEGWFLSPGYYQATFSQGCNLGKTHTLRIKQRSSVVRSGGISAAGLYDPGFQTDNIGCFLDVKTPIFIEKGARLVQAYVALSEEVENTYDGQYQRDKQRKISKVSSSKTQKTS